MVTGSRAEYGVLRWVMEEIRDSNALELQIIATGTHLSHEFGMTYRDIEVDGFQIDRKVEMLLSSDTSSGITKSMGLALIGFADAYEQLNPDLILVLGDRYEILVAAIAAMIGSLPIAHIAGGDYAEGTHDNITRHCITKMSHLHLTTHDGRARGDSVITSKNNLESIVSSIRKAINKDCKFTNYPYGDAPSASKIVKLISLLPDRKKIINKKFNMISI